MDENNLSKLKSDLKLNTPRRLYVFHGEEAYLRRHYLNALKKLVVEEYAEAFNYHRFGPDTVSLQGVLDSIEALPMMAPRSMVELDDVNLFASGEDAAAYAKFFSDIPDYCTVVLVYETLEFKPDRRRKALAEALDKALVVEFTQPTDRELVGWIARHLKKADKRITVEDAQYLIHRTGGSMTALLGELGKLTAYVEDETVTRNHIDLLVEPVLEADVFAITDAIAGGRFETALRTLRTVLDKQERREDAVRVLGAMGSQFRRLLAARRLSDGGKRQQDLMKLCGIGGYPAQKAMELARRLSERFCGRAVELCLEADEKLKTSYDDPERVLEMLVLELAGESRNG